MSQPTNTLDKYPDYQTDIGIEVHVQLSTASKIFCPSKNGPCPTPNKHIDIICAGYPGSLPMLNKQVVDSAIMTGLATNCTINKVSEFARKHYFYPDLPKGYQITQDNKPICENGHVTIPLEDGSTKKIRIKRIHMEEDAGKNIHAQGRSLVDLNRAGSPLLEIVTEPDIKSSYEAKTYLKTLHSIVTYLGITTGNMEAGAFRADTNLSVRKKEDPQLGTRCEMKNINSFKFISDAVEYEIERQIKMLENGEKIKQETRLWNTSAKKTVSMRSKEEAADYRYFKDPDLPQLVLDDAWIENIKKQLPELPSQKAVRLQQTYKITPDEAEILINAPVISSFFEEAAQYTSSPKLINWVVRNVMGYLKEHKITIKTLKTTPEYVAQLVNLVEKGTINTRAAQQVFDEVAATGKEPQAVVQEKGLEQVDDVTALQEVVQEVIGANPKQVAAYKAGKDKLIGFFVGQAMQKTKGKANPQTLQTLAKKLLSE